MRRRIAGHVRSFPYVPFLAVSFLFIVILAASSRSATDVSRPSSSADPDGIATNASQAYDGSDSTFALVNGSGNLSFSAFGANGRNDSDPIRQVDLIFDLSVANVSDDLWALDYSTDAGASWQPLRALATGNLSRQELVYVNVSYTGGWSWSTITENLSVRVRYVSNGTLDPVDFSLYEVWANVTVDREGPSVALVSPVDGTNYSGLMLVNFTYNASDALSGLGNCTLLLNGVENVTDPTPSATATNNFSVTLDDGRYNWSVRCFDNSSWPTSNLTKNWTLMVDNAPPIVTLLSPGNGSTQNGNPIITFSFHHQDVSSIENCTLYLNGTANATIEGADANWPTGDGQFVLSVPDGPWDWNVSCTDIYGRSGMSASASFTQAANVAPSIVNVSIASTIVLSLGANVTVGCNATVTDPQGQLTIANVTAYLHRADWQWNASDETSAHLTDLACLSTGINETSVLYECSFDVPYYARSMDWRCTVHATDTQGAAGFGIASTFIEPLYAFNLSPQVIGYGVLSPGEVSGDVPVIVTNLGNADIDMALDGYALSPQDGLSLACNVGNTTIGDERYALASGLSFDAMAPLTSNPVQVDTFSLPPKNDSFAGQGTIYWKVRLGVPQKGNCSGYVTFTGVQS